jgi:hypothetical protein
MRGTLHTITARGMLKACISSAGYPAGRIGRDAGAAASSQCWGRDPFETLLAMVPSMLRHFWRWYPSFRCASDDGGRVSLGKYRGDPTPLLPARGARAAHYAEAVLAGVACLLSHFGVVVSGTPHGLSHALDAFPGPTWTDLHAGLSLVVSHQTLGPGRYAGARHGGISCIWTRARNWASSPQCQRLQHRQHAGCEIRMSHFWR